MKKLIAAVIFVGIAGVSQAGDPDAGRQLAQRCAACHGITGVETLEDRIPRLAGLGEKYIVRQLQNVKDGNRQIPEMTGIVAGLTRQDFADLAAHFSAQTMPESELSESPHRGEVLYRGLNSTGGITSCISCHGARGEGSQVGGIPRIGGQSSTYLRNSLERFRSGERVFDGRSNFMGEVAQQLSDADIEAVSDFIQGLH